ncbi:MAG: hypothetical protein AAGA56_31210, partial [Myxococcota bacterium]
MRRWHDRMRVGATMFVVATLVMAVRVFAQPSPGASASAVASAIPSAPSSGVASASPRPSASAPPDPVTGDPDVARLEQLATQVRAFTAGELEPSVDVVALF